MKGLHLVQGITKNTHPNSLNLITSHRNVNVILVDIPIKRGALFTPCKSQNSIEVTYIIEGELEYQDGDEKVIVKAGDCLYHNELEKDFVLYGRKDSKLLTFTTDGDFEEVHELHQKLKISIREIETKDNYTGGHCERVAYYAQKIAAHIHNKQISLHNLISAANVHDIGKCMIPDEVLLKPGRFNQEEREIMNNHSKYSYDILKSNFNMDEAICKIAACHHERYDGSGYPYGLSGENIPIEARIISIADTFDAMTTTRPYQKARTVMETVDEMSRFAHEYDPEIFKVFKELVEKKIIAVNILPEDFEK